MGTGNNRKQETKQKRKKKEKMYMTLKWRKRTKPNLKQISH